MSRMIECDSCKRKMYQDSRSKKGSYFDIWVDRSNECHLCRNCFKKRLGDVFDYVLGEENEENN